MHLQDIYCFVLPFVLKWLVAAMVVSVLVDVFSKLREQGDKSQITAHDQIQAMVAEIWQQYSQKAPSNSEMLLTFFRLNKARKSLKQLPSFIRFAPHTHDHHLFVDMCRQQGKDAHTLRHWADGHMCYNCLHFDLCAAQFPSR